MLKLNVLIRGGMTIEMDYQSGGPGGHPTLIVKVRPDGMVLCDLIVEAGRLTHRSEVRKQFIRQIGLGAANHLPMLAGWFGRFTTWSWVNTARRISTVV